MNIRDLEALVAVIETGSVGSAAVRLNLTQPALTRRIQLLEETLGVALLDRASKPHKATLDGLRVYDYARQILRGVRDLRVDLTSSQGEVCGEFSIGIMPQLADDAVTIPIAKVRAEFPNLKIKLTSDWSPSLQSRVADGDLDLAIYCLADGEAPARNISTTDLGRTEVALVASPTLGVPKRATILDLSRFAWVLNNDGCGFRNYIGHTFESARLPFNVAIEVLSAEIKMSLVAAGHGIGIIAPSGLNQCRWKDEIEVIDTPDFKPAVRVWAASNDTRSRLREPVQTFIKEMQELRLQRQVGVLAA
ncbi:LysR family transcriptional regulator [Rhizobium sp. Rhizsp82]|uniref:LysR family transcriptional regulator n=1 Tax=Rhizobium sp. Rhizsp82 TaxID=3243057 RepID=UPI0039B41AFF